MERVGNFIEAWVWIAIGVAFLAALIRPAWRPSKSIAAVNFILFGLTDFIEMHTGAWWRPWWLLVWKGVCVGVMVALLVTYRRAKRGPRVSGEE